MFRVTLTENDNVLACIKVSQARYRTADSYMTSCDECGDAIWRHPEPPLLQLDDKTHTLVPAGLRARRITVAMCLECCAAHQAAGI